MRFARIDVPEVVRGAPSEYARGDVLLKGVFGNRVELYGWALGKAAAVHSIEVVSRGSVVATTTTGVRRPDLAEVFPDDPAASVGGFEVALEAQSGGESRLDVLAMLSDGNKVSLGHLRVIAEVAATTDQAS
jgi:hypothetical protein